MLQKNSQIQELQTQLAVREQGLQSTTQQLTTILTTNESLQYECQQAKKEVQQLRQQLASQLILQESLEDNDPKRPHNAISATMGAKELTPQVWVTGDDVRSRESELHRLRKENELLLRRVQEQQANEKESQASDLLVLRERVASLEEVREACGGDCVERAETGAREERGGISVGGDAGRAVPAEEVRGTRETC